MTDETPAPPETGRSREVGPLVLLTDALGRAKWIIFWERLWPALALVATVIGAFLALSWLGLWLWLPPIGRAVGLCLLAIGLIAAAVPLISVRFPSTADALRRLDRASGRAHRPATAIADKIATPAADTWSQALWRAHVERARAAARELKAGIASPRLAARDPVAVRALVLLLVIATFIAAAGERGKRIMAAFDWHGVVLPANFRLDAWVSPPVYTGKAPVILPGIHPGEPAQASVAAISVPAGSTLVVRASGKANVEVVTTGGLTAAADTRPQAVAGTEEHRFTIAERGTASVRGLASDDLTWAFNAIPDRPPGIALTKDPERQSRGSLLLTYKLEDDYGVVDARATFVPKKAPDAAAGRPLFDPPDYSLVLPQSRTRNGVGQTTKDLTESPWAGAEVVMTLVARDEAKNEGRSAPFDMQLPERLFMKPLSRALIEQRRILALDADARDRVTIALDALAMAPEKFTPEAGIYLGLRSVYWQLASAKSDADLKNVVQALWSLATQIEDGNVSDAEAQLRAAQDALRQALERGASEEEIKRLTDQLRAALDRFLQSLVEELRKNPQMARPLDPNARQLRSQDLKSMIDRLEQLARSGAKDAARALLDQLQQMLENLQMARPGMMGDGNDDMMSALDELGDMIRRQQQLRDRTFQQGQDQRRRGGDPKGYGELRENQQALRDQLKKLMEEMRKRGFPQKGDGQDQQGGNDDQFGQAGEAMGEAEGALGEGNADNAVDSQGRALEALRKGAQGLAQQLQQQMGQGQGPGQPGRLGPPRAQQDTDPLGRPLRGRDYGDDSTVKVPGEIDVQRARRILEELRRRLADPLRPQLELDYIERLLKDY